MEAAFEIVKASLEGDEKVMIKNVGILAIRTKKPRKTGEEIVIAGTKGLTFKPQPRHEESRRALCLTCPTLVPTVFQKIPADLLCVYPGFR